VAAGAGSEGVTAVHVDGGLRAVLSEVVFGGVEPLGKSMHAVLVTGSIARSANLPVFSLLRGQF